MFHVEHDRVGAGEPRMEDAERQPRTMWGRVSVSVHMERNSAKPY